MPEQPDVRCEICGELVDPFSTKQCAQCLAECCPECIGRGERFCSTACENEYDEQFDGGHK